MTGPSRIAVRIAVNGRERELDVEPRHLLVDVLREELGLTGAKVGCDTTQCGAYTVHLDGRAVKSCTLLAVQADGHAVTTIEAIAPSRTELHPLQAAFVEHHGLQCGYCTPGVIMAGLDLLERVPDPADDEIKAAIHGNLCRCTGYQSIVDSIRAGGAAMRAAKAELT